VDVNVHPTKKEVRLSKEDGLKLALIPAIKEALQKENLSPLGTYDTLPIGQPVLEPKQSIIKETNEEAGWIPIAFDQQQRQ
jgi:DNA mismatch repair ATPase MutL